MDKMSICFRIIFSPWRSEFASVCMSFERAFDSKLVVFMKKNLNVNNVKSRKIHHWKENFGKSVQRERKRTISQSSIEKGTSPPLKEERRTVAILLQE